MLTFLLLSTVSTFPSPGSRQVRDYRGNDTIGLRQYTFHPIFLDTLGNWPSMYEEVEVHGDATVGVLGNTPYQPAFEITPDNI